MENARFSSDRPSSGGKFNPGRWLLERERCRLSHRRPPPREPATLAIQGVLERVLNRLCVQTTEQGRRGDLAESCWRDVAGPELCAHTRAGKFERGMLTVYVRNNVWLFQIKRFHARRLEKLLREKLGPSFQRLMLRLDPGER